MQELSLAVVGAEYPNANGGNRRSEIIFCNPGEPIELRPEPKNPVDPYAVAVYSARDFQIGYLTAERAPWIGGMLKNGRVIIAVFQQETPYGALIRVRFDSGTPTLPERTDAASETAPQQDIADDSGFWPDPVYDD